MDYNLFSEQFKGYRNKSITDQVLGYGNVLALMGELKDKKVLDYGCGEGDFSLQLALKGGIVLGADASEAMVELANKKIEKTVADHLSFVVVKNNELKLLADNSFDFVVMNFVICTISETNEIEQIFKELTRLLKPGGQLFILNVNWEKCNGREFLSFKLDKMNDLQPGDKVGSILKWEDNIRVQDYFWSQANYRHFYEQAGLKNIEIKDILATDERYPWLDETKYSPFFIISGQK